MAPKIAIVFYSMYGHIKTLAEAEKRGIEAAGGTADIFRSEGYPRLFPRRFLEKMHAPPKDSSIPTLESPDNLLPYDALMFGILTGYGNFPGQWKAFWDSTGHIWQTGGYWGKYYVVIYAGLFASSATPGGGQESTNIAAMSTPRPPRHHLALARRNQPTKPEPEIAETHGKAFYGAVSKVNFSA